MTARPAKARARTPTPAQEAPPLTLGLRTLAQHVAEWRRGRTQLDGVTQEHADRQARMVRDALDDLGVTEAAGLTTPALRRWIMGMIDPARPESRKTAANRLAAMRDFGRYLCGAGILPANPASPIRVVQTRGRTTHHYRPLTAGEAKALVEAARAREALPSRGGRAAVGPLASTVYTLILETGLRFQELRYQALEDVDLEHRTLTVTHDKAARGDKIALSRRAVAALKAWMPHRERCCPGAKTLKAKTGTVLPPRARLFPRVPSGKTLWRDMRAAGVDTRVPGGWHRLRKRAIQRVGEAGASVRDMVHFARHADVRTTLRVYDRLSDRKAREIADLDDDEEETAKKSVDHSPPGADTWDAKNVEAANNDTHTHIKGQPAASRPVLGSSRKVASGDLRGLSLGVRGKPAGQAAVNGAAGNRTPGSLNRALAQLIEAHAALVAAVLGSMEHGVHSDGQE